MSAGLAARVLTRGESIAARYDVRPYDKTPVPTARELHLLNRFGAGYTPQSLRQLRRAGSARKWFLLQLTPGKVTENPVAASLDSWFPALAWPAATKDAKNRSGEYGSWEHARDLGNLSVLRRMLSNRQVLEQMTDFWSNHLHVPAGYDYAWVQRKSYDEVIRRNALGSFETLLLQATLHPAMQYYLDNWRSVKNAPNENHGRELLELHTVGRTAGYTEQMVKDSAKILSGYSVYKTTHETFYDLDRHTTGAVKVLGFTHANANPDGRAVTVAYLKYLAHHPATAKRIARKLAVRFVSDNPSEALVNRLAAVYLKNGTQIKPVLKALIEEAEFWGARDKKVRTPYDDLVATCRSLAIAPRKPTNGESFANALAWVHGAVLVYQWPAPDGAPEDAASWTSVSRMLSSFRYHWVLSGGWWPTRDVGYRKPASWLPQTQLRLDEFVDHLSRVWLGRRSTPQLLQAVCQAVDESPGAIINASHAVITWKFPRLSTVFFDSPKHMSR
ncbi:MAG TPA: DUF1800 domain-containing protein [Nocardioidaceae bacterium]|nr:DUF1800 domain-containing protein [Nocardioidaceae bacterium]